MNQFLWSIRIDEANGVLKEWCQWMISVLQKIFLWLKKCLAIAEKLGFKTVHGIVLAENRNMLALGEKLGFGIKRIPMAEALKRAAVRGVKTHVLMDPFSLLLSLEANIAMDDQPFAKALGHSLKTAMADEAHKVDPHTWKTQPVHQKIANWICYGLARFMTGMAGVAPAPLVDGNNRKG